MYLKLFVYQRLQIIPQEDGEPTEPPSDRFGSMIYLIASVLDPSYGLLWLEEHPGSVENKQQLKESIIGKDQTCMLLSYTDQK